MYDSGINEWTAVELVRDHLYSAKMIVEEGDKKRSEGEGHGGWILPFICKNRLTTDGPSIPCFSPQFFTRSALMFGDPTHSQI
jgi:hypothetical protein